MVEIGNFYDPYRRSKREHEAAMEMLALARKQEREKERLVAEGKLSKVVEYDPQQRLTKIWYRENKPSKSNEHANQSTSN